LANPPLNKTAPLEEKTQNGGENLSPKVGRNLSLKLGGKLHPILIPDLGIKAHGQWRQTKYISMDVHCARRAKFNQVQLFSRTTNFANLTRSSSC